MLIVDDNIFSSIALVTLFQTQNLDSDVATDGIEALESVKRRFRRFGTTYDLIVMDYQMPI